MDADYNLSFDYPAPIDSYVAKWGSLMKAHYNPTTGRLNVRCHSLLEALRCWLILDDVCPECLATLTTWYCTHCGHNVKGEFDGFRRE